MRITHRKHRDPQRLWPAGECSRCGAEQYPGGIRWRLNGQTLCRDCALFQLLEGLLPLGGKSKGAGQ